MEARIIRPKKRRLLLVGVAILIIAILSVGFLLLTKKPTSPQTGGLINKQWLDEKLVEWKPISIYPMNFGVEYNRISYANIFASYNTDPVLDSNIAMLYDTGSNAIRADINYDAWLKGDSNTISRYDSFVNQARSNGKTLVIADASAESYRSSPLSWNNFKTAWAQRVQTIAQRYHPDYYIVVKEPDWYLPMIQGYPLSPPLNGSDWAALTGSLATTVKAASPTTKVGVAVAANVYHHTTSLSFDLLKNSVGIQGVDFIGFDIYGVYGFDDTLRFLNEVGSNGKSVWIAESWSSVGTMAFDSSRSDLDKEWITVLYYFALKIKAQMMIPFFTDIFASYQTPPKDSTQLINYYQNRTPVFYEFKSIIASNVSSQQPSSPEFEVDEMKNPA